MPRHGVVAQLIERYAGRSMAYLDSSGYRYIRGGKQPLFVVS